jgi:dihydroxyacetone kinase-like protein
MLEATKAVNGGAGVLHVVKNYTGDVMNFDMAADMGKGEDIEVETVLTNDDVAVEDSLYTAGRRGVGVTVLVEKICGAAADDGKSLAEVAELGPEGQRQRALDGHGPDSLHHAGVGRAQLRARR